MNFAEFRVLYICVENRKGILNFIQKVSTLYCEGMYQVD